MELNSNTILINKYELENKIITDLWHDTHITPERSAIHRQEHEHILAIIKKLPSETYSNIKAQIIKEFIEFLKLGYSNDLYDVNSSYDGQFIDVDDLNSALEEFIKSKENVK